MTIFTHRGDEGMTSLATGERVLKCDDRVEAYGTLDELSAFIGVLKDSRMWTEEERLVLTEIQKNLQVLCARFAGYDKISLPEDAVAKIEQIISTMALPPLMQFVIPGGNLVASYCHVCRTICRRAERLAVRINADVADVRYLNRLGDYFFELSRNITLKAK